VTLYCVTFCARKACTEKGAGGAEMDRWSRREGVMDTEKGNLWTLPLKDTENGYREKRGRRQTYAYLSLSLARSKGSQLVVSRISLSPLSLPLSPPACPRWTGGVDACSCVFGENACRFDEYREQMHFELACPPPRGVQKVLDCETTQAEHH